MHSNDSGSDHIVCVSDGGLERRRDAACVKAR